MRILIACIHYPVASGRYIQRALERLGHDVRTVGPSTGNQIWGMSVDVRHVWEPSVLIRQQGDWLFPTPIETVQRVLGDWQPELVITADSAYTLVGPASCSRVCWGVDNHVRDYHYDLPGGMRDFDAMFLAHSWGARMDEPNAHWLPAAYDPAMHYDEGHARPHDVVMAAVPYGPRLELVQALRQAGLDVQAGMGALWDDYRAFYNQGKIALVKSACGDLSQRFLEAMAMGCCVLADSPVDATKLGFVPGIDYYPYYDAESAVRGARYLLKSGQWQEIAANGKRKVAGHTWDSRASELLTTVFEPKGA